MQGNGDFQFKTAAIDLAKDFNDKDIEKYTESRDFSFQKVACTANSRSKDTGLLGREVDVWDFFAQVELTQRSA